MHPGQRKSRRKTSKRHQNGVKATNGYAKSTLKMKLENTEFAVELSSNKQSIYSGMLKTMRQTVETKSLKKKNKSFH